MAVVTPAQLLLALAEHGSLEAGAAALGLSADEARGLLRGAAASLQRQTAPDAAPARPTRTVRKPAASGVTATGLLDAPVDHARAATPSGDHRPHSGGDHARAASGEHRRLRVFSDGASRGNPGPAGAGAVLQDEGGHPLERLGRFLGKQTNNVAEYEGLLLGLRRAHELGARDVDVFADSELLIRQLQGRYKVKNAALQRLHAEAVALLRSFTKVTLQHVPRAQNTAADEMSNRAIDEKM